MGFADPNQANLAGIAPSLLGGYDNPLLDVL
jgi:hypothetical protein